MLGITTCTGEAEERAKLASMLCLYANRPDIPIYPGPDGCLVVDQIECSAPQKEVLSKWPHQKEFRKGYAIEFLRKTIRENPGEITLIAVAPMTNIALLFSVDPEIPKLLKGLYLICFLLTRKFLNYLKVYILCVGSFPILKGQFQIIH